MQGNTSGNFSDLDGDLLDSVPHYRTRKPPGLAMTAATVIVGATGLVGNLLVVIVFIKYKKLFQNIKTTFLVNQSVIDGIVSLLLILTTLFTPPIDSLGGNALTSTLYCKLWIRRTLMWGLMVASTYNLMAISFERYLGIVHPMWHKVYFTNSKANIVAVCVWFFGVSFIASIMIPPPAMKGGVCISSRVWSSRAIALTVGYVQVFVKLVMPIFVHSLCYARILSTLRKRMTRITPKYAPTSTAQMVKTWETRLTKAGSIRMLGGEADSTRGAVSLPSTSGTNVIINLTSSDSTDLASRSSNKQPNSSAKQNDKAKENVVKTLSIVTVCYFICWVPNSVYVIMHILGAGHTSLFGAIYKATVILAFINCCINPIIYIGKYDAFTTGLSMLVKSMKLRR